MSFVVLSQHLGVGSEDAPQVSDGYKRGVLRPPPARFAVEMLPPTRQGSAVSFGMRIHPITRGDRSSTSSRGSDSTIAEYDIWRRWEDCLWFQDVLEVEYQRRARQKKQRLRAGKGVKKNGFYRQDMASSWESLPPGPDPSSVAQDIHAHVPRLTKKGTIFRASQATIDERQKELKAFVQGLLQDGASALMNELTEDRIVTDFFGYWRRDAEIAKKEEKARSKERASVTSTILSESTQKSPSRSPFPMRRRAHSATSSDSSARNSIASFACSGPSIAEDVPVIFEHNPMLLDRPNSVFEAVPENKQLSSPKMRRPSTADPRYRNTSIYGLSPEDLVIRSRAVRESWQTTDSASTYLEGLNMTLPDQNRSRMSVTSIATVMTGSSVDAVIPRATPRRNRDSGSSENQFDDEEDDVSCIYDSFPVPSFQPPSPSARRHALERRCVTPLGRSKVSEAVEEESDSSSPGSPVGPVTPTTPTFHHHSPTPSISSTNQSVATITPKAGKFNLEIVPPSPSAYISSARSSETPVPVSPTSTVISTWSEASSATETSTRVTVKAVHNESIILLRVIRDSDLAEVRNKIKEKFSSQEKLVLTESFTLAVVLPTARSPTPGGMSNSLSSAGGQLKLILTDNDWQRALTVTDGSKITVRVLDT